MSLPYLVLYYKILLAFHIPYFGWGVLVRSALLILPPIADHNLSSTRLPRDLKCVPNNDIRLARYRFTLIDSAYLSASIPPSQIVLG